jgi:transposase
VLTLPPSVRIYLAAGVTDLRKSFDGLSGLVRTALAEDPTSGHLFVFCNRRRDRLKVLYFDGSGLWVFAKRLEQGTFAWPDADATTRVELRAAELALLLGGLDLSRTKKRRWYLRQPA